MYFKILAIAGSDLHLTGLQSAKTEFPANPQHTSRLEWALLVIKTVQVGLKTLLEPPATFVPLST